MYYKKKTNNTEETYNVLKALELNSYKKKFIGEVRTTCNDLI
jgi:hypothetical protein